MSFNDDLKNDMSTEFLDSDEFAEDIVYTPKAGSEQTVSAIVNRNPVSTGPEDQGRVLRKTIHIIISNDSDSGIEEIDTKGDKVTVAPYPGQDAVDYDVVKILESGPAHWKLEATQ